MYKKRSKKVKKMKKGSKNVKTMYNYKAVVGLSGVGRASSGGRPWNSLIAAYQS
jgi:hypothetical protein